VRRSGHLLRDDAQRLETWHATKDVRHLAFSGVRRQTLDKKSARRIGRKLSLWFKEGKAHNER
jgi:hypothetical protein